ncbi:MAG: undecaprenyl-diphosphate phosphatase [Crocinitomicaceae bacterium]|nr:undecaprenyl-diphosphate phosphatase [Crocinitomicaceae bacterium]
MSLLETILIAIVEGLTEFLPISSTGHMIIAQKLLGIESSPFTKAFIVNIQFGAILSVVVLYWKRFFQNINFYFKLLVAFIPAAILGFLLKSHIDLLLDSVETVAIALLLGGLFLIGVDKWLKPKTEKEMNYPMAFRIGLFQCIAMIPGVSRSAATIVGGMTQGLTRKQAAEFSFFLAVPTMFGASALELYQAWNDVPELFNRDNLGTLITGNMVAFIVAMLAIRFFISFLTKNGFRAFGWYRIILGSVLLILLAMKVSLSMV